MDISQNYQAIGTELSKLAPEPFSVIKVDSEVTDDTADMGVEYIADDGVMKFIELSSSSASVIANNLISLRKAMKQEGRPAWSHSVFTLTPDGKFNLEVSYDD